MRKKKGVNYWDTVFEERNNTVLLGTLFPWSPVQDSVWKSPNNSISSPVLDYFWRAMCCISHCTSQKSYHGFSRAYSACFIGSTNYSCRVCLCQLTHLHFVGIPLMCSATLTSASRCCFWSPVRSQRKMLMNTGLLPPARTARLLAQPPQEQL